MYYTLVLKGRIELKHNEWLPVFCDERKWKMCYLTSTISENQYIANTMDRINTISNAP